MTTAFKSDAAPSTIAGSPDKIAYISQKQLL